MLHSRTITTSLQGESVRFRPARGCPQRGVLSPLLWSILVDGLVTILSNWEADLQAYADDLVLVIRNKSEEMISNVLQDMLNTVYEWCEREGMFINPHKMVIVPYTRRRKLNLPKPPSIDGINNSLRE